MRDGFPDLISEGPRARFTSLAWAVLNPMSSRTSAPRNTRQVNQGKYQASKDVSPGLHARRPPGHR